MRQRRRFSRLGLGISTAVLGLFLAVTPTLACGGLIGPNGAVNLLRTTTLAGYHDGVEHYVTAFEFAGGGGAFGSITPLPGVPASVVKGGDWTLQRLSARRARRAPAFALGAAAPRRRDDAQDLMKDQIDALDITVLQGRRRRRSGCGPRTTGSASAGCAGGPRLLRRPQPDLPRRRVRRRCGRGARPADRRRDAGPHHDPDRQPVGPAPDPRPRQDRRASASRPTSTS